MIVDLSQLRAALNLVSTHLVVVDTGLDGAELDAYVEAQALVDDAARLFLAEREAGDRIWYCQTHKSVDVSQREGVLVCSLRRNNDCRMVEAWLTVDE